MRANDASLESSIKGGTHNKRCVALPPDEKLDAVPSSLVVEVGWAADGVQGSVEHISPPRTAAFDWPERSTLNESLKWISTIHLAS